MTWRLPRAWPCLGEGDAAQLQAEFAAQDRMFGLRLFGLFTLGLGSSIVNGPLIPHQYVDPWCIDLTRSSTPGCLAGVFHHLQ